MKEQRELDDVDRRLIELLQDDGLATYAQLGADVGLSAGAVHNRVRAMRERGVIERTTLEIDPPSVGKPVLAYVLVQARAWMGGEDTAAALRSLHWIEEAHIIAGAASLLVKVRAESTADLQTALRRIFEIDGVATTESLVVLETVFERPTSPIRRGDAG